MPRAAAFRSAERTHVQTIQQCLRAIRAADKREIAALDRLDARFGNLLEHCTPGVLSGDVVFVAPERFTYDFTGVLATPGRDFPIDEAAQTVC